HGHRHSRIHPHHRPHMLVLRRNPKTSRLCRKHKLLRSLSGPARARHALSPCVFKAKGPLRPRSMGRQSLPSVPVNVKKGTIFSCPFQSSYFSHLSFRSFPPSLGVSLPMSFPCRAATDSYSIRISKTPGTALGSAAPGSLPDA